MNRLAAVPLVVVLVGLVWPVVALDGQQLYLDFLMLNARVVLPIAGCWGIVLYWLGRRIAELALWRGAGAKLRLRERTSR